MSRGTDVRRALAWTVLLGLILTFASHRPWAAAELAALRAREARLAAEVDRVYRDDTGACGCPRTADENRERYRAAEELRRLRVRIADLEYWLPW